ncbi:MAG: hypothetical protein IKU52_03135 [Clostridia bacterium]|nr:hypothetical protein [Clostridia bacterium]
MNKLKKILVIILCIAFTVSCTSCSIKDSLLDKVTEKTSLDYETVKGKWVAKTELNDLTVFATDMSVKEFILSLIGITDVDENIIDFEENCEMEIVFEFTDEDTVEISIKSSEFDEFSKNALDFTKNSILTPELFAEIMGMSIEEFEDTMRSQGLTAQTYIDFIKNMLPFEITLDDFIAAIGMDSFIGEHSYSINEDTITIQADKEYTLNYENKKLILKDSENNKEFVFEKHSENEETPEAEETKVKNDENTLSV